MIKRDTPREGEWWRFGNGKTARIAEVTDPNYGAPEIAYTNPKDLRTGFKFNAKLDPMPMKKVRVLVNLNTRYIRVFISI